MYRVVKRGNSQLLSTSTKYKVEALQGSMYSLSQQLTPLIGLPPVRMATGDTVYGNQDTAPSRFPSRFPSWICCSL